MKVTSSYTKLLVWQKAFDLVIEIYRITENFPASELYGLVSQMRRAAVSILSNIAEGSQRKSDKDFLHFINIALSSSAELETQILVSHRLGFIKELEGERLLDSLCEVRKMLVALDKHIKQRISQT